MKILVIGSGGREHAIIRKFAESKKVDKIYVSPGNPGMKQNAETIALKDFDSIKDFVKTKNIQFVFVGPEQPLSEGLVDFLEENRISVIGPSKNAAQIESSKVFSKRLMKKFNIPTAEYSEFTEFDKAKEYVENCKYPTVIKADGLAAGKGVVIAQNKEEAIDALKEMMINNKFGKAGDKLIIEEFMEGWEASVFAFCDGDNFQSTVFSQDHKPVFNDDKGPNTGGMGAYAPVEKAEQYREFVNNEIIKPTLAAMKSEGFEYKGVLYAGLMITKEGPKVVEFNCRFGDPETEVVLPLLKTDLVDVCEAILNKKIDQINLEWLQKTAITVVGASKGYPESYPKGLEIVIDKDFQEDDELFINYAGVKESVNKLYTNGGRVLMLTSLADTLEESIEKAYTNLKKIHFDGMHFRTDIGSKGLM